jgi:hypothetical protein
MLMPPGQRDQVTAKLIVRFIMDAGKALDLSLTLTHQRGMGHNRLPVAIILNLLMDCCTTGVFPWRSW